MWSFKKDIYKTENIIENGTPILLCFDPVVMSGACSGCNIIELSKFDYMLVRFLWEYPSGGKDLDIFVGYQNTGTIYDNDYVGYGQGATLVPPTAAPTDAYLWWATDDVNGNGSGPPETGVEAVIIGINSFITGNTTTNEFIDISLNATWYEIINDGKMLLELTTYTGGTMQQSGTDIINVGGGLSNPITTNEIHVTSQSGSVNVGDAQNLGTLRYNKLTNTGVIILTT